MHSFSEERIQWKESSRLIYWGALIIAIIGFIAMCLCSCTPSISIGSAIMGMLYTTTDIVESIVVIRNSKLFQLLLYATQIITFSGWILTIVGLYRFRKLQYSIKAQTAIKNLMIASGMAGLSVIGILFSIIFISNISVEWVIIVWVFGITTYIVFLISFRKLYNDISWNEAVKEGINALKSWAICNIWLLVILAIIYLLVVVTIVLYSEAVKSLFMGESSYSGRNAIDQLNNNYETLFFLEFTIGAVIMILISFAQLYFYISGWYKIMNGGLIDFEHTSEKSTVKSSGYDERGYGFCNKCGNSLPKDSSFCPKCGAPVISGLKVEKDVDTKVFNGNSRSFTEPEDSAEEKNSVKQENNNYEANTLPVYDEDDDKGKRKKLIIWSFAIIGLLVLCVGLWAIFFRKGEVFNEAKVYVDAVVYANVDEETGIDPLTELSYGTIVMCGDTDDKYSGWVKVEVEKDGKKVKGYVNKNYLLNSEDFTKIDRAGMSIEAVRINAWKPVHRLAIADALSGKDKYWKLEVDDSNASYQYLNSIETYVDGVTPSESCFGFVLYNDSAVWDREFYLYSLPENDRSPVAIYTEKVKEKDGKLRDVKLKQGRYQVKYYDAPVDRFDLDHPVNVEDDYEDNISSAESDNFADNSMHGSIDGKYDIIMDFVEYTDGSVNGTYKYVKYNTPITIVGSYTIGDDGIHDISLEEQVNGKVVGNFVGRFDGRVYVGSWLSADGEKELPFKVEK